MILKVADDKSSLIHQLEKLLTSAPAELKPRIEVELRNIRSGLKAEQEAAYLIDFDFGKSTSTLVIHDLRLVVDGRVAQIDHLLIHRTLNVFVLETKHLHAGMKITENGEFMCWNAFKKCFEGMPSPFAQNERHISVLKDVFARVEIPSKLGVRISPSFHSYVLISPKARIDRPRKFDTSHIVKADMLGATLDRFFDKAGVLDVISGLARIQSQDSLEELGRKLVRMHRPASIDYAAKFGVPMNAVSEDPVEGIPPSPPQVVVENREEWMKCRECTSPKLSIQYGKYGYYFRCEVCGGNTPIRISCGKDGHKERIRKDGLKFYRECSDCKSKSLFFVNRS